MATGTLFLIPTTLGASTLAAVVPPEVQQRARTLLHFVAENPKTARAYLKQVGATKPLQELRIATLNENTPVEAIAGLAAPLLAGHDLGVMSEAGCPGIADPGAKLVLYAHRHRIRVVPLVGPSSILLALIASGLNGQSFVFHGYLPVADVEREKALRELENQSRRLTQTQIFIETPYRNQKLVASILAVCARNTLLCVAADLTLPGEDIRTMTVAAWKKQPPQLDRRPAIFLLLAA
ncbi:MAG: SAM-dependent methyltransferase [Betaproteobacteria bacterium]|nr:MAG: SAM-dependent methyltransferase [Betaproteobacteria bacterium]